MTTRIYRTLFSILMCGCFLSSAKSQTGPDSTRKKPGYPSNESVVIIADTTKEDREPDQVSHFETGFSYQSNDVYLGRKDSAVLPYYIPSFAYYHKSGLYITASLNYLKNATGSRIDLFSLEAGYMFSSGNYEGQIMATRNFYNSQSTSVKSEIMASVAYMNGLDLGFIKTTFTGTLNIGRRLDFAGLFGIEHTFSVSGEKMDFTPMLSANASTQNYYSDYYKNRRYSAKRKGQKPAAGISSITGTVTDASEFKVLDYEASLPVNYRVGNCTFNFTPVYSIPVHPANLAIQTVLDNGAVINKTKTEQLGNSFYWTAGVSLVF